MTAHTLILIALIGAYGNVRLEKSYDFASLEACSAALAAMRVEQVTNSSSPDPVMGFCVPSTSVAKSPELVACEADLQLQNEAATQCNSDLSACQTRVVTLNQNPVSCPEADLNGDGIIGAPDQGVLTNHAQNIQNWFGQTCP